MRVLITGAEGFIGKNLCWHLSEHKSVEVITFTRQNNPAELQKLVNDVDCVFHLAGVNRPSNPDDFATGNADLTKQLCEAISVAGKKIRLILASSTQAERDNPYGISKRNSELAVEQAAREGHVVAYIYRLPNVFGKWCKPNYNSAVATFCHNITRGLPITVNDPAAPLTLAYVDDVVSNMVQLMDGKAAAELFVTVKPTYTTTVGQVADLIRTFHEDRQTLKVSRVGTGLSRALYATYVSCLRPEAFSYVVPRHADERGVFVEMLKTADSGQFSFFTALPGITRGGHYHHTKTEKFLIIRGTALYKFRNIESGETYEICTTGEESRIIDTAPGWSHDITNVGNDELIVMLWANEVFDRDRPDTVASGL
jgi:UDP-2-acetamido-2,6-beta-L-arabino-hexul-4-ose reductase